MFIGHLLILLGSKDTDVTETDKNLRPYGAYIPEYVSIVKLTR